MGAYWICWECTTPHSFPTTRQIVVGRIACGCGESYALEDDMKADWAEGIEERLAALEKDADLSWTWD